MRTTLNMTTNLNYDPEHRAHVGVTLACLRFLFQVQLFKTDKTTISLFSSCFLVSVAALLSAAPLYKVISGDIFIQVSLRERTFLAQSTNAISCYRSAESVSRPADSKEQQASGQKRQKIFTVTQQMVCPTGYKTNLSQLTDRTEDRRQGNVLVRRAEKNCTYNMYTNVSKQSVREKSR